MEVPVSGNYYAHGAVEWTGGVKDLLEESNDHIRPQLRPRINAFHCLDQLEPTSVLDVGSRFSPPLECTCSQYTGLSLDWHPEPSCPHANPVADQAYNYIIAARSPPSGKKFQDSYSLSLEFPDSVDYWLEEAVPQIHGGDATGEGSGDGYNCNQQEVFLLPYPDDGPMQWGIQDPSYPLFDSYYINSHLNLNDGSKHTAFFTSRETAFTSCPDPYTREEEDMVDCFISPAPETYCDEEQTHHSAQSQSFSRVKSRTSFDSSGGASSCYTEEESMELQLGASSITVTSSDQQEDFQIQNTMDTRLHSAGVLDKRPLAHKTDFLSRPTKKLMVGNALTAITAVTQSCDISSNYDVHSDIRAIAEHVPQGRPSSSPTVGEDEEDNDGGNAFKQDEGLHQVHLLLACAEALAWRDLPLAASLLEQLTAFASSGGDSIQRVTYCFAEGLSARLATMSGRCGQSIPFPSSAEKNEGLLQLYNCTPYLSFAFFAANEAILQVFEKKDRVHIIDLGMMVQGLQWTGLIRALAKREQGPPHVRLTAIAPFSSMEGGGSTRGISCMTAADVMQEMARYGEELKKFAASVSVTLEFEVLPQTLDACVRGKGSAGEYWARTIERRPGETLAINSVLQLHGVVKESRGSLKGVLQGLQRLCPAVMTVAEQDASHNGPFFLGRFMEALHYYASIFDSLEASLPRHSVQRRKVEGLHFGMEIRNIVACEGAERVERHERGDQWRRHMSRAGFQGVPLRCMSQAQMLLSLYSCHGYTLSEEKGCLTLGWKGKPIIFASAWTSKATILSAAAASSSPSTQKKPPLS